MDSDMQAYQKALEEKHGRLTGCSSCSSSNGMMINSNSLLNYELEIKENDGSVLTVSNKAPFQKTVTASYRIKDKDLKDLCTFIEENRFWAFRELQYHQDPAFIVYDYSRSSSFTLKYDDSEIGGSRFEYLSINADAMRQHKFNELCDGFTYRMDELAKKGELFSTKESGENSNFFVETPEKEKQITADGDTCPCCGYKPVIGRFCPECGSLVKK
ncbi:MAG: hypothetical protein IKF80_03485 [Erysipelotrichaceae bacterium]|nr:hypothetical protein [Erysipelotrichaceae bacterium]